jgi:hypothetical protein
VLQTEPMCRVFAGSVLDQTWDTRVSQSCSVVSFDASALFSYIYGCIPNFVLVHVDGVCTYGYINNYT